MAETFSLLDSESEARAHGPGALAAGVIKSNLAVSMCLVPDAWQASINTPKLGHPPTRRPGLQEGEERDTGNRKPL